MRRAEVAALDLELTGLDPAADEVVEVGVARGRRGGEVATWSSLVRPSRPVTPGAAEVTGLDDAMLAGAPPVSDVLPALRGWLDGAVIVAHGGDLDEVVLRRTTEALGQAPLPAASFDTRVMARAVLALRSHTLSDLVAEMGLPVRRLHRALPDALATLDVFWTLVDLIDPDGALDPAGLAAAVADARWDSAWRREQRKALDQAWRQRRSVHLRYVTRDDAGAFVVSAREVSIYKIAGRRLQGFCHLRGEERVFRMERLREVRVGERGYLVPNFVARI